MFFHRILSGYGWVLGKGALRGLAGIENKFRWVWVDLGLVLLRVCTVVANSVGRFCRDLLGASRWSLGSTYATVYGHLIQGFLVFLTARFITPM